MITLFDCFCRLNRKNCDCCAGPLTNTVPVLILRSVIGRKLRYTLTITVAVVILVLSLIPKPPDITSELRFGDKLAHFAAYFVLSLLIALAMAGKRKLTAWTVAVLASFCYGAVIEVLQHFTPRQMEALDLAFNLAGSLAGATAALMIGKYPQGAHTDNAGP
jgi:VanZ family protein